MVWCGGAEPGGDPEEWAPLRGGTGRKEIPHQRKGSPGGRTHEGAREGATAEEGCLEGRGPEKRALRRKGPLDVERFERGMGGSGGRGSQRKGPTFLFGKGEL